MRNVIDFTAYCWLLTAAFLRGAWEFRSDFTTAYWDLGQRDAYDAGREAMHRITRRRHDDYEAGSAQILFIVVLAGVATTIILCIHLAWLIFG